jgi:NAD(P)-dependent dehydrogenase (short-subunit alcohol dehydrogenase family)
MENHQRGVLPASLKGNPMNQSSRLAGKVAIITGATGGIGEATARRFLQEGARVMLVGRSADKLQETRVRLNTDAGLAHFVAEATDEEATAAAVAATIEAFDGVDILFANAGTEGKVAMIEDINRADFEQVLQTNVIGVWLAMKYCVQSMKQRGGGSIIITSSIAGVTAGAGIAPYNASKHAVNGLMKSAALELGAAKIRVNAIAPGPIDNRMIFSLEAQALPENPAAVRDDLISKIALQRYGTNEEVANLALFLASDESAYCSGGVYMLDGGYTAA